MLSLREPGETHDRILITPGFLLEFKAGNVRREHKTRRGGKSFDRIDLRRHKAQLDCRLDKADNDDVV